MVDQPVNRRLDVAGQSAGEDRLLAMIAALAAELSVTRERLDTLERLVEAGGVAPRSAIEAFVPDAEASAERDVLRKGLISRIFRPIRDAAARGAQAEGDAA
jgi:hypothetical protein